MLKKLTATALVIVLMLGMGLEASSEGGTPPTTAPEVYSTTTPEAYPTPANGWTIDRTEDGVTVWTARAESSAAELHDMQEKIFS